MVCACPKALKSLYSVNFIFATVGVDDFLCQVPCYHNHSSPVLFQIVRIGTHCSNALYFVRTQALSVCMKSFVFQLIRLWLFELTGFRKHQNWKLFVSIIRQVVGCRLGRYIRKIRFPPRGGHCLLRMSLKLLNRLWF